MHCLWLERSLDKLYYRIYSASLHTAVGVNQPGTDELIVFSLLIDTSIYLDTEYEAVQWYVSAQQRTVNQASGDSTPDLGTYIHTVV